MILFGSTLNTDCDPLYVREERIKAELHILKVVYSFLSYLMHIKVHKITRQRNHKTDTVYPRLNV